MGPRGLPFLRAEALSQDHLLTLSPRPEMWGDVDDVG